MTALAAGLLLAGLASAANAERILVYPPDKAGLTVGELRVVGLATDGETAVKLTVANSGTTTEEELPVVENSFNLLVALKPGENTFTLAGASDPGKGKVSVYLAAGGQEVPAAYRPLYLHPREEITADCKGCHLTVIDKVPVYTRIDQKVSCQTGNCHANFGTGKFQHGPVKKGGCVECHNPHGADFPKMVSRDQADLCYYCHATEKNRYAEGVVHFPVRKGDCLSCHEPHQSDFEFHLKRGNIRELCSACHGYERLKHTYMHEPVQSEDCIACHSPHSSPNKNLLVESGINMCFACHEERKEEFASRNVHAPLKKEGCIACHDPHGSETIYHLRTRMDAKGKYIIPKDPIMDSCMLCHSKQTPALVEQMGGKVQHKPVQEGKCTYCHTPHSTNNNKLLQKPEAELCFSCHKEIGEEIKAAVYKHGPIRTNDCYQCHRVHGSGNRKLLAANFTDKYQVDFELENYRLCFNCHNEKVVAALKSVDTNFRNGDINLHYVHVNKDRKGRSCSTCHEIHASDQPRHMRSKIPFKGRMTISLEFTPTETGGGCVVGCHKPRDYDRERPVGK
ncbi:MAG: cytochrome c3 family protein [Thermodesulfobacteriota bacterium]